MNTICCCNSLVFFFVSLSHNLLCGDFKLRVASVLGFLSICSLKQHLKMWCLHYIQFCPIHVGIVKVLYEHSAFCLQCSSASLLCMLQLVLPLWQGRAVRSAEVVLQYRRTILHVWAWDFSSCRSCVTAVLSLIISPPAAWPTLPVPCTLYLSVTIVHSLPHFYSLSSTWVFSYCSIPVHLSYFLGLNHSGSY